MTEAATSSPELSLVIPLYNEKANVPRVPADIAATLDEAGIDYELVLVNNGSRDDTGHRLAALAATNPRIQVVTVPVNQGYGWGVLCGVEQARGHFVGFMGGDGQIRAEVIPHVFALAKSGHVDLAKVRRVTRGDGPARQAVTFCCNLLFPLLFPVRTRDINGTPKIARGDLLRSLQLRSKDWFIDAEVMIGLGQRGARIGELDVDFLPRDGGSSNVRWTTIVEFLRNIWRSWRAGGRRSPQSAPAAVDEPGAPLP
jgi:glycosyltransferase involved in cell wall biosynthesis